MLIIRVSARHAMCNSAVKCANDSNLQVFDWHYDFKSAFDFKFAGFRLQIVKCAVGSNLRSETHSKSGLARENRAQRWNFMVFAC